MQPERIGGGDGLTVSDDCELRRVMKELNTSVERSTKAHFFVEHQPRDSLLMGLQFRKRSAH